jgi:hypothetical protein
MNWEALGAIGDTLGAVAVFVTLGYLAVQVKHAAQEARRTLSQNRMDNLREINALATDERVNRLLVKANEALGAAPPAFVAALTERAGLTIEEAYIVHRVQIQLWNYTVQMIPNVAQLSETERHQFDNGLAGRYSVAAGVGALFLETVKQTAHAPPNTVRYIDNVLASST